MINLTSDQIKTFEKIWFIYGNHGKKSTMLNHKLIQGFIEANEDRRKPYLQAKQNIKNRYGENSKNAQDNVTDECLLVVDLILNNKIEEALKISKS